MSDRKQNRTDNGTDRLQEIRARLDAATPGPWWTAEQRRPYSNTIWSRSDDPVTTGETIGNIYLQPDADLIAHAPDDIAWLVDEVERLERENAFDVLEITRKASDAEDYWMQEAKRLAAEVERLEGELSSARSRLAAYREQGGEW